MIAARTAAAILRAMVPPLVERSRCAYCIGSSSLLRQDGNACAEGVEVARGASATRVDRLHVLDEMAGDLAAAIDRVGAGTRIALLTAVALAPAGHVERGEPGHRDDVVASTTAEGPERDEEHRDNAWVPRGQIGKRAPVVLVDAGVPAVLSPDQ